MLDNQLAMTYKHISTKENIINNFGKAKLKLYFCPDGQSVIKQYWKGDDKAEPMAQKSKR